MDRQERREKKGTSDHSQVMSYNQKTRFILFVCMGLITFMLFIPLNKPAYASEGGASSFTPGAQGDFAMCYYPQGLYIRENIVYTDGSLNKYPVQPGVNAKLDSRVWFDLLQVLYSSNLNILGGHYFANINIPVGIDADLIAKARIPQEDGSIVTSRSAEEVTGLGDIQAVPFGLVWDVNDMHFLAAQNFVLTTGRFDPGKLNNMGRNYFSYDEVFGFTWLDQKGGHEVSFVAGYMINTKNQATEYKTGDEFHVDYTLAQYLSKQLGFGVVGYYYKQMTDDESKNLDQINAFDKSDQGKFLGLSAPGGYKSKGAAVGPAVLFTPNIGGKDVNLIVKWLYEFSMKNRLEGNWVWLSAVVKF